MSSAKWHTDTSLFLVGNPYGFKINLFTNPVGRGFYEAFLKKNNIPSRIGLSDIQRRTLEAKIEKCIVDGTIFIEQ